MFNFDNLTSSLSNIKKQYFPNNQIEKDIYEIIFSPSFILDPKKLEIVKNYCFDLGKINQIIKILNDCMGINSHYKNLINLLNLLEFLLSNTQVEFYNCCVKNPNLKFNLNELSNSYLYLEDGIDKSNLIKHKIETINLLLNNNEYFLDQRAKAYKLKNMLKNNNENNYSSLNLKLDPNFICDKCKCDQYKNSKLCKCNNCDKCDKCKTYENKISNSNCKISFTIKPVIKSEEVNDIDKPNKLNKTNSLDLLSLDDFNNEFNNEFNNFNKLDQIKIINSIKPLNKINPTNPTNSTDLTKKKNIFNLDDFNDF